MAAAILNKCFDSSALNLCPSPTHSSLCKIVAFQQRKNLKSAGDAIIEKPREPAHIIVGIARMMLPVHANRSITRAYKTLYPLLRSHPYPLVYPDSYSGLQLGRDPASPPSPSQEHLNIPPGRLRSCRYPFPPATHP